MNWLLLGLPCLAGLLMAVQGSINGQVSKYIGALEGNFLMHLIGLAALFLLLFVVRIGDGDWSRLREIPWYGYGSGLINVVIIYGVAIIAGQVTTAALIDWLGLFGLEKTPFSLWQGAGIVLLAVGARLLLAK